MATIRQTIEIRTPVHVLYHQLTRFENYPRFMEDVEAVRQIDDTHLHWTVRRAEQAVEWDAEISEQEEDRCIAWHSVGGPSSAGRVEVQEAGPDSSRLTFTLQEGSEQTAAGNQQQLEQQVQQNLARLKEFVESGEGDSSYAAGSEGLTFEEELSIPPASRRAAAGQRNDSTGAVSRSEVSSSPSSSRQTRQTVAEVMTPDVGVVSPQENLQRAAQLMDELNVGALPVCEGDRLVGIVTDRDITVRGTAAGKAPTETRVEEVMSADVRCCFEDQSVDEVMQQMADIQIRRVPVISHDEEPKLVGIVSLGDLATKSPDAKKRDVEALVEKIASPSEPDRSSRSRQAAPSKAGASAPGVTARIDPSGGTRDQRAAGNKDDIGSNSAGVDDAGTSGGVAGAAGSGGTDLGGGS